MIREDASSGNFMVLNQFETSKVLGVHEADRALVVIEHYDVVPDILVYGKNLSGGIAPLCGISARDDIMGDNKDADLVGCLELAKALAPLRPYLKSLARDEDIDEDALEAAKEESR